MLCKTQNLDGITIHKQKVASELVVRQDFMFKVENIVSTENLTFTKKYHMMALRASRVNVDDSFVNKKGKYMSVLTVGVMRMQIDFGRKT